MDVDERVKILVVDDHPDKLLVFRTILADLNEDVVTVSSGREALKALLTQEFAVILLDVKMPDMGGFETAALIRGRKKTAHTPIIFVTAYEDELHAAEGYSLGAVDYILTPIVPDVLRSKVRVFVQLYRMQIQIRQQAEERIALMREQAARAITEEAIRRSAFLAEASHRLGSSLDVRTTVRELTRFVVPVLADVSALALLEESGEVRETHVAWAGDAGAGVLPSHAIVHRLTDDELAAMIDASLQGGEPALRVLETPTAALAASGATGEPITLSLGCRIRNVMGFPLRARGRELGVLLLGTSEARAPGAADLALAADLAGRTAIALDNGSLYSKVQEADHRKDEFLAMLAHELRNPLAPIRTALAVLRRVASPDPIVRRSEDIIDRQVEQLTRMVDDLLDVSRLTQGKIRLDRVPVELAVVMERAVDTVRPEISRRNHRLEIAVPAEPVFVDGDPVRLTQVLANLLNNAAKYTPEGGEIRFGAERQDAQVVIRVRDNGTGIPAEILPYVFDLFTQANRSLARSEGGLGIGLTVVRSLVEKHGGTVDARSEGIGHGSEFIVRLPVQARPPADVSDCANGHDVPAPAAGGRRILLVDDNLDSNEALDLFLQLEGHVVRKAADGADALQIAREFHPQLVVCDIGLPDMDGYEVIRCLRAQAGADMPVVFALTGYAQERDCARVKEAGFSRHLLKPVDPAVLKELIASDLP